MVSIDTTMRWGEPAMTDTKMRIESEPEVRSYLQDLCYALEHGNHTTFVMSFHYAEIPFIADMFPYRKRQGGVNQ